jgi:hypothetical protein
MRANLVSNRISRCWRVALHHSRRPQSSRRARITGLKQKNRGPAWPCARKLGGGARQQCVARLEAEAAKARQEAELQHKGTGRCILLNFNNDCPTPPTPPTLPPPRRHHAYPVPPHLLHAAAAAATPQALPHRPCTPSVASCRSRRCRRVAPLGRQRQGATPPVGELRVASCRCCRRVAPPLRRQRPQALHRPSPPRRAAAPPAPRAAHAPAPRAALASPARHQGGVG